MPVPGPQDDRPIFPQPVPENALQYIPQCRTEEEEGKCKSPEMNSDFTNPWACKCKVNADPPLPKRWPDPYKNTPYEDDLKLCYGMQPRPFLGCGYPYQGSFPGQFGKFQNDLNAMSYPWATLDWPCPPKFPECCHYDPWVEKEPPTAPLPPHPPGEDDCANPNPNLPQTTLHDEDYQCFYEICDGTVIGKYSPCCCSEYYGSCRNVCDDPNEEDICGCWPRRQVPDLPFCMVPDGRVLSTGCPRGADHSISDIAPKRKSGQNVQEMCGGLKLYTRRDSKYTLCGGYKLAV